MEDGSIRLAPLPDINEVRPVGQDDDVVFAEIRDVLKRHGALQRFGVTLLHQHFPIAPGEVLVENIDVINRVLTTSPKVTDSVGNAVETSWRLDHPDGQQRCETRCESDRDADGRPYHRKAHYTTS
jgi:hypothetical protein